MTKKDGHKTIADIPLGGSAVIMDFVEEHMPVKMLEMGLLPGNIVSVKQIAPFNDPIHIQVGGYALALRRSEAQYILVSSIKSNQDFNK